MEKNDPSTEDARPRTIEEFLRERERIDNILQKEFKKETTILFTDICGYTSYTEKMGDLSSRAMLQKHNDIVLPLIAKYDGGVVKTIGDAVMATFASPLAAVKAASDIQDALHRHNLKAGAGEKIRVKIGINTGDALMDRGDVFGDAVNVAARIQSAAGADQILVSSRVYDEVCGSDDVLCRIHEKVQAKGKAEPIQLYRVVWKDEEVVSEVEPKVRAGAATQKEVRAPLEVLHLEVAREGNRIKLCAYEQRPGETSTIQHYEETRVSMDWVKNRCHEMVEALNKVNRRGLISREVLMRLREIGQVFSDELFTLDVKEKLRNSRSEYLILNLDDQLVHVPWELLYDGKQFLCQRFSMGRLVRTRQAVGKGRSRVLARPLKMLVLADPGGDLEGAYNEGTRIRDIMDMDKELINATLRSENITPDLIRKKIRNFDLIHFAGHADYDPQRPAESGWRLTGGSLKASDITKMAGAGAMPALIFSNACQSARTEEWGLRESFQEEIFGLANVFLLAGVKHFVGTFWEIMDEPSSRFATEFYQFFMSGMTMGEAVREARRALIREYGEENIVWASYILYGDPTSNYLDQIMATEPRKEAETSPHGPQEDPVGKDLRSGEETIDFAQNETKKKGRRIWMATAAGALVLAAVLLWGYPGFLNKGTVEYEKTALACYSEGAFDKALNACKTIEEKNPRLSLSYLIRGDVYFRKGDLDAAEAAYQQAVAAKEGTHQHKANAFIGLGRIASIRKETDKALGYYGSAARAAPESGVAYLSQALVFEDRGEYGQALDLIKKARQYAPKDQAIAALANETRKKAELAGNQEGQARIDRMVRELVETMNAPPVAPPSDGWTSLPLTLWVMDFSTQGYSLQEGEEKILVAGIQDQFLQHSRARLVERAILDRLLAELKLGTSQLADRQTALSLGRLLAARLILTGQVVYSGPQTQVSLRLIETETGRISASLTETSGSAVPVAVLSDKLAKLLLNKLNDLYPLRGKIAAVEGDEVTLNIGQSAGTRKGQKFAVVGQDMALEVISDEPETSSAKIVKGEEPLNEGMRVEQSVD